MLAPLGRAAERLSGERDGALLGRGGRKHHGHLEELAAQPPKGRQDGDRGRFGRAEHPPLRRPRGAVRREEGDAMLHAKQDGGEEGGEASLGADHVPQPALAELAIVDRLGEGGGAGRGECGGWGRVSRHAWGWESRGCEGGGIYRGGRLASPARLAPALMSASMQPRRQYLLMERPSGVMPPYFWWLTSAAASMRLCTTSNSAFSHAVRRAVLPSDRLTTSATAPALRSARTIRVLPTCAAIVSGQQGIPSTSRSLSSGWWARRISTHSALPWGIRVRWVNGQRQGLRWQGLRHEGDVRGPP